MRNYDVRDLQGLIEDTTSARKPSAQLKLVESTCGQTVQGLMRTVLKSLLWIISSVLSWNTVIVMWKYEKLQRTEKN